MPWTNLVTTSRLLIAAVTLVLVLGAVLLVAVKLDKSPQAAWDRWYSRIDSFPSTKALILFGMGLFFTTGLVVAGNAIFFAMSDKQPTAIFVTALDTWLDKVLVLMGIGTAHFIGKRATTKPGNDADPDVPAQP